MSVICSTNKSLMELISICLSIGQKFHSTQLFNLIPTLNPTTVPTTIIIIGELIKATYMLPFTKIFSSLMLYSSTIIHKRILFNMLSPNKQSTKPFTYDTIPVPKLGIEYFSNILIPSVEDLLKSGANINGFVDDKCPTQIMTPAHLSPSFIFK